MKKIFLLFLLLFVASADATIWYVNSFEADANINDTTAPSSPSAAHFGNNALCAYYNGATGTREKLTTGTQFSPSTSSNTWLVSPNTDPNTNCERSRIIETDVPAPDGRVYKACSGDKLWWTRLVIADGNGGRRERQEHTGGPDINGSAAGKFKRNEDTWIAASYYIPQGYCDNSPYPALTASDNETIFQIHETNQVNGSGVIPLLLRVSCADNSFNAWGQVCTNPGAQGDPCISDSAAFFTNFGTIVEGDRFNVIMRVNVGTEGGNGGGNGIEVWHNGDAIGSPSISYSGPLGGNNTIDPNEAGYPKYGFYKPRVDDGPGDAPFYIQSGRDDFGLGVDTMIFGDENETYASMLAASGFPNWTCYNDATGVILPTAVDYTHASQTQGTDFSISWSDIYANDTYVSTTSPAIGDITNLTSGLLSCVNDIPNTEVDCTHVSGVGNAQFTRTLTDDNGLSNVATVFIQITGTSGSHTPPTFGDFNFVTKSDGSAINMSEPDFTVDDDWLIYVHGYKSTDTIPPLESGWTSICTVDGPTNTYRVAKIKRSGAADTNFAASGGISHSAAVQRVVGGDGTDVIDDFDCTLDGDVTNTGTISQSLTTSQPNLPILYFAVGDTNSMAATGTDLTEVWDRGGTGNTIAGYYDIGPNPAGSTTARAFTADQIGSVHIIGLALLGQGSAEPPTVLEDTFTETGPGDVTLNARAASPTAGTTNWEADTSYVIDSATDNLNGDGGDSAKIAIGVINSTHTITWTPDTANDFYYYFGADSKDADETVNGYYFRMIDSSNTAVIGECVNSVCNPIKSWPQIIDVGPYTATITRTNDAATCTDVSINVSIDGPTTEDSNDTATTTSCLKGSWSKLFSNDTASWIVDDLKATSDESPDTTAPTAPVITGTISQQAAMLSIAKGSDVGLGIEGYSVEKQVDGGGYTELIYTLDETTGFSIENDTIGPNETVDYRVRHRGHDGNWSPYSNVVQLVAITNNDIVVTNSTIAKTFAIDQLNTTNIVTDCGCTDPDGDTIIVDSIVTQGAEGTVTFSGSDITYDTGGEINPDSTSDSFVVKVTDQNGSTSDITYNITYTALPAGQKYVEFPYYDSNDNLLTNQENISFFCISSEHINDNFTDSINYIANDEVTDESGMIKIILFDADAKGVNTGDQIGCVLKRPNAASTDGFSSGYGLFTVKEES